MNVTLPTRSLTLEDIADSVCSYFGVAMDDLRGRSQRRSISYPRRVFMVLSRERTRFSSDEIGAFLGRTRWNVWRCNERVFHEQEMNPDLRNDLAAVRNLLNGAVAS